MYFLLLKIYTVQFRLISDGNDSTILDRSTLMNDDVLIDLRTAYSVVHTALCCVRDNHVFEVLGRHGFDYAEIVSIMDETNRIEQWGTLSAHLIATASRLLVST